MKLVLLFALFLLCLPVAATVVSAQAPALIDREIFFGNPEYAGAQISPDGKFISFVKPYKDTMNIWVKGVAEPFAAARPMTADTKRPVTSYFWSRDGKYLLFVQDKGGDENFNVYAVDPSAKPAEGSDVPVARNITEATNIRALIQSVPRSDPDAIYVGLNDRDPAWHDLYKIKISTGERTLISQNKDRYQITVFDNADKMRLAVRAAVNGSTEFLRLNADGSTTVIYSCGVLEQCSPVRFHKNNKQVYIRTNAGDIDLIELQLLDLETGKTAKVESDPDKRVDLGSVSFSDVTQEMIATAYDDDRTRIYWKNKAYENDYNFIKKKLGDREISFNSATADETKFIVATYSDVDPGTVWLFDRKTKNLSTLYQVREKLDRKALAPMKPIRYRSSDGLEIPAYLTLPKGVEAMNLPMVVLPHGGPWARDAWGYSGYVQFLANRGYAVLQPNFRSSTGYGKKFLNAGNKQWGDLMQDDITWGVKHLTGQGIVDPKRVAIMGGSYGGYATLAGVTFTPDLYAAAVAIVAPSNLKTLLESIPPYWEAGRIIFHTRMGDPNTSEGLKELMRQSPLTHADKITTPLMVVQGANDPRVKQRESDQIVIALRDRKYPVEYILAPDEGHGFARPVNNMAMLAAAEKFLAKHIGGRYQSTMTPEVSKRLAEITVDPATVKLEVKPTMNEEASVNLTGKWDLSVDAGGQMLDIGLDIMQAGNALTGSMRSMLGGGTIEKGVVSGDNVEATVKAEVQGQSMELKLEGVVKDGVISGTISAPGLPLLKFTGKKGE
jgi:dipeptidyl aminopeptidase/acylaminoacyl peptidase